MSIRATVRITGVAKNTIVKLLADFGEACADYQDAVLTNLPCQRIESDEIWSFCYAKQKNVPEEHKGTFGYGDVWTWTAFRRRHEAGPVVAGRRAHRSRCLRVPVRPQVPPSPPGAAHERRPPSLPDGGGAAVRLGRHRLRHAPQALRRRRR